MAIVMLPHQPLKGWQGGNYWMGVFINEDCDPSQVVYYPERV